MKLCLSRFGIYGLAALGGAAACVGCAGTRALPARPPATPTAAMVAVAAPSTPTIEVAGADSAPAAIHRSLTLEGARTAIAASVAAARAKHTTAVIAVVDAGGNLMALERIDETFAAGALISIGKARTAVLFKKPTRFFEELIKSGRTPMIALHDFTPLQGGVPIAIGGEVVGGIGVSGAASAAQDEELAMAGASAIGQPMVSEAKGAEPVEAVATSATEPQATHDDVVFFPHEQVAAAFVKGTPLVERRAENYKIHASRRDGPGKAEVHTRDADVIYVLGGTATLITGGTVVDPKPIDAEEIRGASVQDGQLHKLVKGDVMVVPKGVPHWFKEVFAPFTYYVVKVRS